MFKMAACFAAVMEEEICQINEEATPANTKTHLFGWLILKQLVMVTYH